tara:strand:+ start:182 stop:376 length:195 start_codon:yes stop_codon:yes gene_type:complete
LTHHLEPLVRTVLGGLKESEEVSAINHDDLGCVRLELLLCPCSEGASELSVITGLRREKDIALE